MRKRNRRTFDKKKESENISIIFKCYGPPDINPDYLVPEKIEVLDDQTFYNLYTRAINRKTNSVCITAWVQKRENIDMKKSEETMRRLEEALYYSSDDALEDIAESIRDFYRACEEHRRLNSFEEINPKFKIEADNKVDSLLTPEPKKKAYSPSDSPYVDSPEEHLTYEELLVAYGGADTVKDDDDDEKENNHRYDYDDTAQDISLRFRCNIIPSKY